MKGKETYTVPSLIIASPALFANNVFRAASDEANKKFAGSYSCAVNVNE